MTPTAGRESSDSVTQLLVRWRSGDKGALESLMPIVHTELQRIAHRNLRRERRNHTLQTTALVNEAYLQLVGHELPHWHDRAHFFGIAAHLMRQVLVEYARRRNAAKRGGQVCKLSLHDHEQQPERSDVEITALDDALGELAKIDPQQSRVVELRFFGGLSIEDTAVALGISVSTVKRDWNTARVWLYRELDRTALP